MVAVVSFLVRKDVSRLSFKVLRILQCVAMVEDGIEQLAKALLM
jgi:hypothetical protein